MAKVVLGWCALMILIAGVAQCQESCDSPVVEQAAAQPREHSAATPEEEALALALAKVTVNEAGWRSPADMDLIWQVTRAKARTAEDRLVWLRAHSSCVLGAEPPAEDVRGNCRWTWYLADDDRRPANFPEATNWDGRYVRYWRSIREAALQRVLGGGRRGPCPTVPDTWGGRMDHEQARARGMIRLFCTGSINDGYLYGHNEDRLRQFDGTL